jgi:hypothetical protein
MPVRSKMLGGADLPDLTPTVTYTRKKDQASVKPEASDLIAWRHVQGEPPTLVFRSPGNRTQWVDEVEFTKIVNWLSSQPFTFATKAGYEPVTNPVEGQVEFVGPKTSRGRRRVRFSGGRWIPYPRTLDDLV